MDMYAEQAKAEVLARYPNAKVWGSWSNGVSGQCISLTLGEADSEGGEQAAWIDARNRLTPQQLPARVNAEGDGPRVGGL